MRNIVLVCTRSVLSHRKEALASLARYISVIRMYTTRQMLLIHLTHRVCVFQLYLMISPWLADLVLGDALLISSWYGVCVGQNIL